MPLKKKIRLDVNQKVFFKCRLDGNSTENSSKNYTSNHEKQKFKEEVISIV
jgi:hypothetical protein